MKLPAYTNEERKYLGVAQHEFHPHPADFLDTHPYIDFEYADAVEEGEQVLVSLLFWHKREQFYLRHEYESTNTDA